DARIDLMESRASSAIGDFKRAQTLAGKAVLKGRAQQAGLVVAQARSAEGFSLERLGQSNAASAALEEAQGMFTAAGDKMGAAQSLALMGHVLYDRGDFNGALKAYQDSFSVFRTLGNKLREAAALNNIGNIYYDQGDLEHAKQYYEQSVADYREID